MQSQLSKPFAWRGGVNISALAAAEQRSYGFYHWYVRNVTVLEPTIGTHFQLNASQAGTGSGLAKMPYLRDSRRSGAGIDEFRVFYANLSVADPVDNTTAVHWPDAVGIGQYFFADIHTMTAQSCPLPIYLIPGAAVKPYYIPFRALTVNGAPNVLVCGKSMAMSFWANAAMRLHPEEWTSGVAAGTAAALMVRNGWDTSVALANIDQVQYVLIKQGQPLKWTFP